MKKEVEIEPQWENEWTNKGIYDLFADLLWKSRVYLGFRFSIRNIRFLKKLGFSFFNPNGTTNWYDRGETRF